VTAKKIMIIDDDQHLLLGLTARLKANEYVVVSAGDSVSAIAVARKEVPDLIILDLERIRGLADLAGIPVIVLSARDPAQTRQRALDAGAVAFFQKPPDNHEFLTTIRQALGENIALSTFLKT